MKENGKSENRKNQFDQFDFKFLSRGYSLLLKNSICNGNLSTFVFYDPKSWLTSDIFVFAEGPIEGIRGNCLLLGQTTPAIALKL